jgi:hypothetical protein
MKPAPPVIKIFNIAAGRVLDAVDRTIDPAADYVSAARPVKTAKEVTLGRENPTKKASEATRRLCVATAIEKRKADFQRPNAPSADRNHQSSKRPNRNGHPPTATRPFDGRPSVILKKTESAEAGSAGDRL